jgi:hypothetical protein
MMVESMKRRERERMLDSIQKQLALEKDEIILETKKEARANLDKQTLRLDSILIENDIKIQVIMQFG